MPVSCPFPQEVQCQTTAVRHWRRSGQEITVFRRLLCMINCLLTACVACFSNLLYYRTTGFCCRALARQLLLPRLCYSSAARLSMLPHIFRPRAGVTESYCQPTMVPPPTTCSQGPWAPPALFSPLLLPKLLPLVKGTPMLLTELLTTPWT
jgi:hypothetical protein